MLSNPIFSQEKIECYNPSVSIIITCKNEIKNIKSTIDSIINSKNKNSFEVIIVDDSSEGGSCEFINTDRVKYSNVKVIFNENSGTAAAKNLGARNAIGEYLIFCDSYVLVPDYWIDDFIKTIREYNAQVIAPAVKSNKYNEIVYAKTWNKYLTSVWMDKPEKNGIEIPIVSGTIFFIKKDAFNDVGGFEEHFKMHGKENEEISLKLWLFGYKVILNMHIEVVDVFETINPMNVKDNQVLYDYLAMIYLHFNYVNMSKGINLVKNQLGFSEALASILTNEELFMLRKLYFNKRKYNENYFFDKFKIQF